MKKIVSLLLAVSMVLSMFVSAFAATTYPDLVKENAKYAAAVDALTELGVVNGFPDEEFKPGKELTRAEVAKMLVICLGLGDQVEALATRTVFTDVPASHWAAGYINAAAQSKIIVGYPDGRFQPEKNVSYAEAFTMALRALGYGNVVEAEGTWPTAYMLKAVELELTDDMENVSASAASLRGNTAILLWNMLRTPMWRITEESETNGMTLSDRNGRIMLNVKFPNYWYYDADDLEGGVRLEDVTVTDYEDVTVKIAGQTGKIENVDLTKLIVGMKVSALVKDYKNEDKAKFLTITPANTVVAGVVTNKSVDNKDRISFKVDDVQYRFEEGYGEELANEDYKYDYIVMEAEGKKVLNYYFLNTASKYIEDDGDVKKYDEEALAIIDGKWGKAEDIEIGSIVTEATADEDAETYYLVSTNKETVPFDLMFEEKEDWDGATKLAMIISLDGEELRIDDNFEAYENEKNTKPVPVDENHLLAKYKDNDYSDTDVEVFYNYLGLPARVHFGDISKNSTNTGFYVVTSNGAWSEGSNKGKVYNLELVGQDGEENSYTTVVDPVIENDDEGKIRSNEELYKDEKATFVWVKFDDSDENIENIVLLEDEMPAYDKERDGKDAAYQGKYDIIDASGLTVDGKKIKEGDTEKYRLASITYFYEASAQKEGNPEKIVGFDVNVTTDRAQYDGTELPEGTLIAIKDEKVKAVFIPEESASSIEWGKLVSTKSGKTETVEIDTTDATDLDTDKSEEGYTKGDIVGYTVKKDGKKVVIDDIIDYVNLERLVNTTPVKAYNSTPDVEEGDDFLPLVSDVNDLEKYDEFNLDTGDSEVKADKRARVYKVSLSFDKDNSNKVTVDSVKKVGTGRPAIASAVTKVWDRIVAYDYDEDGKIDAYFVFTGIFSKDLGLNSVDFGNTVAPVPTNYTVTYAWDGEPVEGVELPSDAAVEEGSSYTVETITADGYTITTDQTGEITVTGDVTIYVTATPVEPETFTVTYTWADGKEVSAVTLPEAAEVNSGDSWSAEEIKYTVTSGDDTLISAGYVSGDEITFTVTPDTIDAVTNDETVEVSYSAKI